jgi:hypothetical protein
MNEYDFNAYEPTTGMIDAMKKRCGEKFDDIQIHNRNENDRSDRLNIWGFIFGKWLVHQVRGTWRKESRSVHVHVCTYGPGKNVG